MNKELSEQTTKRTLFIFRFRGRYPAAGANTTGRFFCGLRLLLVMIASLLPAACATLPAGKVGHRSLFAGNAIVAGSQRSERWLLWPTGVLSPGAMRQWGNHATAFIGRRHFDDPYLLENFFIPDVRTGP
jgi:hypothetical protein